MRKKEIVYYDSMSGRGTDQLNALKVKAHLDENGRELGMCDMETEPTPAIIPTTETYPSTACITTMSNTYRHSAPPLNTASLCVAVGIGRFQGQEKG